MSTTPSVSHSPHQGAIELPRPWARQVPALTASGYQALLDALDVGVLVCDADGRLLHANAAAELELRHGNLLALLPGQRLSAVVLSQRSALQVALQSACQGRHQLLQLEDGPQRLSLSVQPIELSAEAAQRHALLMLGRRSVAPELVVAMLCRLHDLTSAEQRILSGLLRGRRVAQLAQQHGVKVSTVRTQVAALRAKLGVRRMDDALRMAAELPPMASALRRGLAASVSPDLGWALE